MFDLASSPWRCDLQADEKRESATFSPYTRPRNSLSLMREPAVATRRILREGTATVPYRGDQPEEEFNIQARSLLPLPAERSIS